MESTRGHGSLLVPRGRRTTEDRAETATGQRSATEEGGWRRGGRGEDEGRRWRRDRRRCAALENPRAVEDPSRLTRRRNFARVLGPGPVPRRGGADRAACAPPRLQSRSRRARGQRELGERSTSESWMVLQRIIFLFFLEEERPLLVDGGREEEIELQARRGSVPRGRCLANERQS